MKTLRINGRIPLSGAVEVGGSKNAALPCLAASLCTEKKLEINRFPEISDTRAMLAMLEFLGIRIRLEPDKNRVILKRTRPGKLSKKNDYAVIPAEEAKKIRASVLLLGPLLRSYNKVYFGRLGGCKIGPRPITAHLYAFEKLGMIFRQDKKVETLNCLEIDQRRIEEVGEIWLPEASVTATENVLLYAFNNRNGPLRLINAACEPHVITLGKLLNQLGGAIHGLGTNVIILDVPFTPWFDPDRVKIELEADYIEALTFAVSAAVTHSDITIERVDPENLTLINFYLNKMGVHTVFSRNNKTGKSDWCIFGRLSSLCLDPDLTEIKSEPWPGLPTDALPLLVVLATQCQGRLEFVDYMYNGRLSKLAHSLSNMGAKITLLEQYDVNRGLIVDGPASLIGREELSPDLRNGMGLVLAGLCAEGETVVGNAEIVERGYERLSEKLSALGAKIVVEGSPPD